MKLTILESVALPQALHYPVADVTQGTQLGGCARFPIGPAAARAMPAVKHGAPCRKAYSDNHGSFLSSVGGHNMDITCWPAGLAGCASATRVVAHE